MWFNGTQPKTHIEEANRHLNALTTRIKELEIQLKTKEEELNKKEEDFNIVMQVLWFIITYLGEYFMLIFGHHKSVESCQISRLFNSR